MNPFGMACHRSLKKLGHAQALIISTESVASHSFNMEPLLSLGHHQGLQKGAGRARPPIVRALAHEYCRSSRGLDRGGPEQIGGVRHYTASSFSPWPKNSKSNPHLAVRDTPATEEFLAPPVPRPSAATALGKFWCRAVTGTSRTLAVVAAVPGAGIEQVVERQRWVLRAPPVPPPSPAAGSLRRQGSPLHRSTTQGQDVHEKSDQVLQLQKVAARPPWQPMHRSVRPVYRLSDDQQRETKAS